MSDFSAPISARELAILISVGLLIIGLTSATGYWWGQRIRQAREHEQALLARQAQFLQFETELEALRQQYHIPGMSVAVVQEGRVVLARGFGYADIEHEIPATEHTPYRIASLTKPIAAAIVMQLVEEGKLDLDTSIATYEPGYAELCEQLQPMFEPAYQCDTEAITVRHHLTHTAQGTPGNGYLYNGNLYAVLSQVTENVSGQSFEQALTERVIAPLHMEETATSQHSAPPDILAQLAQPYRTNGSGYAMPSAYPGMHTSAAAGIISTVLDLAVFSTAMDDNLLVSAETRAAMYSPGVSNSGQMLPYGLGWFVQDAEGTRMVWHYGWWPGACSGLLLKLPEHDLALVLLANSDGASAPFAMGETGDVLRSPFANAFINAFVPAETTDTTPAVQADPAP
jgi:CubicO group peptidase (beta-lactamase class C family)